MKKSLKKKLLIIGLVIVTIPLLFVAIITIMYLNGERKFENKLCELRKQGYPTTGEELNEFYKQVPKEENAALIYEKAFKIFEKDNEDEVKEEENYKMLNIPKDYQDKPVSKKVLNEIAAYLATKKEIFSLLEDASKLSKSRYPINFNEIQLAPALPISASLNTIKLLSLKLFFEVESKKYDNIEDILYQQIKFINSIEKTPFLINGLVLIASIDIIFNNMKILIQKNVIKSEKQIDRIKDLLSMIDCQNTLKSAFIGELVFFNEMSRLIKTQQDLCAGIPKEDSTLKNSFAKLLYKALTIGDHYRVVSMIEKLINLYDEEHNTQLLIELNKYYKELEGIRNNSFSFNHLLFKNSSYFMEGFIEHEILMNSYKRMILTSLELERYKLKHKIYPTEIKNIISKDFPKLLIDPFSDKPFKYIRKDDNSYKLYSFGKNMIDDNGYQKSHGGNKDNEDFVLEIKKTKK